MSSEWSRLTIGQLVESGEAVVQTGPFGSQLHSYDYVDKGVPVVPTEAIGRGRITDIEVPRITPEKARDLQRHRLREGDILFARRGAQATGLSAIVDARYTDGICGTGALLLRTDSQRILPDFLAHFLASDVSYSWLRTHAVGAVMPNINTDIIKALPVLIPPMSTQREIAEFLSAVETRITLLRETNATLEAIAQALFKSWFVDFDPVRAKCDGRAPDGMDEATAALFPDSFEDSELGEVPRGWEISTLGECTAYLNRGISPKYVEEGGIVVLNQKCIRDFSVDPGKARRHDTSQRKVDGRELQPGDVLVNSTGVGTLGRVAQIVELEEPSIVDSHVTVVRANDRLTWNFLGLALMRMQPQIEQFGEGTTGQTELSRGKLAGVKVVVPPTSVLGRFDEAVIPLRMRVAANRAQARSLAALRDTLLPRLISGQLRLPRDSVSMEEALT